MLDIAFELIGEATSNSLLMFCFCNFIIVIILTGSSKPTSMDSQDPTSISPVSFNMSNNAFENDHNCDDTDEEMTVFAAVSSPQDESLINASSVSDEDEDRGCTHCSDDTYDHDDDEDDEEDDDETEVEEEEEDDEEDDETTEVEEEEEDDDDLRKRVEEFIAKINNEWRHEKLKALNLVY